MNEIKMGSLFDGSAGFPLAGIMCGMEAVWASEIEPYPIRVTTKRLPFMKHYGDISKMNGAEIEPVDVITGGSPCQDMSIAGKRAGLDGKRSSLFREQIRIIKEMREATNGKYPRYMVWENVPGALSSNKGADFRCVLEETARIKDAGFNVPMPAKNKWSTAGLIMGDGFSIGWRILDAQYWGVPQRRRRIFLVADFGGTSSGEILFKRDGLHRNFTESSKAWKRTAGDFTQSTGKAGEPFCYNGENLTSPINKQNPQPGDPCHTLGTDTRNYVMIPQFAAGFCTEQSAQARGIGYEEGKSPTLRAGVVPADLMEKEQEQYSVDFGRTSDRIQMNPDKSVTLLGEGGGAGAKTGLYCLPKEPYVMNERQYACTVTQGKANTLTGTDYKGTQCVFVKPQNDTYSIRHAVAYGIDRAAFNQGENALDDFSIEEERAQTLVARGPGGVSHQEPENETEYIVRRLTPLECSRLQGFPDWWTANLGTKDEDITDEMMDFWREVFETHREIVSGASKPKTDKQIRKWLTDPDNDSAEYKMWGNGVALPCVLYVMEGIAMKMSKGGDAND